MSAPENQSTSPGERGTGVLWLASLLLFGVSFAAYAGVAGHEFIAIDDPGYVLHRRVTGGLTAESVRWAFTAAHSSNWHPLTWLAHMLDHELFGADAGKHLLVNAGLHACNGVLVLLALAALTRRFWPSLIVAALFALHPQRVESVAWASERKDVLAAFFFLLTLWAYARYARAPGVPAYLGLLLCFVLGLLAKPMLVTLPAVLLLLDLWPLGRLTRATAGRLVLEKLPLFALAVASSALTLWAQGEGGAIRSEEALPMGARVSNALVAWWAYLVDAVWPSGLAIFYPHPALVDGDAFRPVRAEVVVLGVVLAGVLALAVASARRRPWITVGVLWYLVMLVPVIGIVQVGGQAYADRYTYLPFLGVLIACVFGLAELPERPRRMLAGGALVLALVFGALTRRQVALWRDTPTLLEHTVRVTEKNYFAHNNLGVHYLGAGQLDLAAYHFEQRLAVQVAVGAIVNLGIVELQRGDRRSAERLFTEVLNLRPRQFDANRALGLLYAEEGRHVRAVEHLERAVEARPRDRRLLQTLAAEQAASGDAAAAERTRARMRAPGSDG